MSAHVTREEGRRGMAGQRGSAAVQGGYLLRAEAQISIQNIVRDKDSPHTAF